MKKTIFCFAILIGGILLFSGCSDDDNPAGNSYTGNGKIAYIYQPKTGYETPEAFKEFLDKRDSLEVDLIKVEDIIPDSYEDFTLPDYSLIIIDSETGDGSEWGDSVRVALIKLTNRPILGLGFGGVRLFTELNLSINWNNCNNSLGSGLDSYHKDISVHNTNPENIIIDTTSAVFKEPNEIRFRYDSLVVLHYSASLIALNSTKPSLPDSLVYFGRQPDNVIYYSLVREGRYFLWGFAEPPEEMTDTGLNLFENIVKYMINLQ